MTTSPYLDAFNAYHARGNPDFEWRDVLDFHLQAGVVFSDPQTFLMARRVDPEADPSRLVSFEAFPAGRGWFVWIAAGDIAAMVMLAELHNAEGHTPILFSRVWSPRVRRYTLGTLKARLSGGMRPIPRARPMPESVGHG